MVQGGDPTNTQKGGESIWGIPFEDEFSDQLSFNRRGILGSANNGRNSNMSQFFLTFGPAEHLNRKHTVFGTLIFGYNALDELEKVPNKEGTEAPLEEIVVLDSYALYDPFEDEESNLYKINDRSRSRQGEMPEGKRLSRKFEH